MPPLNIFFLGGGGGGGGGGGEITIARKLGVSSITWHSHG